MRLERQILWRLFGGLCVLWGALTLTFFAIHVTHGDPALAILGADDNMVVSRQVLERVRKDYGLDQPLFTQYTRYLGRAVQGDLGESYRLRIPVSAAIGQQLGASVWLAVCATCVAVAAAVLWSLLAARRAAWVAELAANAELAASSVPSFVLGLSLLLVFSFHLYWLPAAGQDDWRLMILPVVTLAVPIVATLSQVLRQELEQVLEQPFILTTRTRGLSDAAVRLKHALRHALIPLLTLSSFVFGSLLGGVVIVETLFSRQGVGRLMIEAVTNKDVPLVLGVTLLAALSHVVINLVTDVLYTVVDPRVKATV